MLAGRLRLKLGKQDANEDFSASNFGDDFINSSFGVIPTVPLPTFPLPALGGDPDPKRFSSSYGLYLLLDQTLWVESGEAEVQGLGAFAQFGWTPEGRSALTLYWGGGLSYTGLFPGRGEDVLGIGIARARLSGELSTPESGKSETAIELFYRAALCSWLTLQPDIQVILNPGATGDDAVAAGLRFEVGF